MGCNISWIKSAKLSGDCGLVRQASLPVIRSTFRGYISVFIDFYCSLKRGLKKPGLISGIFFAGYGLSRFIVEFFRVADAQFISFENPQGYVYQFGSIGATMGQVLSLPMIVIGCVFVLYNSARKVN